MTQAGNHAGFWRSVRELPGRSPLRVKLITALLALVALALAVISVAGIAILKGNLLGPYDDQLQGQLTRLGGSAVANYLQTGETYTGESFAVDWIAADGSSHRVVLPVSQSLPRGNFPNPPGGSTGPAMSGPLIQVSNGWISSHLGRLFTVSSQNGAGRWRVLVETLQLPNGSSGTMVVAINVSTVYNTIGELATIDLLVSLVIIGLLGIAGVALVRSSLRPLTDIEQTAGAIAAGDLSKRVPERDPRTEVGRLGRSLNVMLSQIESAFRSRSRSEAAARRSEEKMRQFVADASHELRTPLTAIRGFAEYYRQRGGIAMPGGAPGSHQLAPADMDRIMRRVEQESARMGILVEDMLLLARLDQQRPLEARPVDLLTLAADAVHDARVVAPSRSINLTVASGRALLVIGDEVRLRQVIGNLMSNALTHTPDGTPIDVLIRPGNLDEAAAATAMARADADEEPAPGENPGGDQAGSDHPVADSEAAWDAEHVPPPPPPLEAGPVLSGPAAVLEVTDHGPGLSAEQATHVFERFYRADPARTKGGTGLGLAIVAALVGAHGGAAWVQSLPGEGATFCIALPLAPEAVPGAEDDDGSDAADEDSLGVEGDGNTENGHPESGGGPDPGSWISAESLNRA